MSSRREPHAPEKSTNSTTSKSKKVSTGLSRNLFSDGEFTIGAVTVESVKRARELRSVDFLRYKKLHNFFTTFNLGVVGELEDNCKLTTAEISAWVNDIFVKEVATLIEEQRETKEKLLVLLIVAAVLAKHGEQTLVGKDNIGELNGLVSTRYRSYALRSSKQPKYRKSHKSDHSHEKTVAQTMGLGFVHQLMLQLPYEKHVRTEDLTEILNHNSNIRLLANTNLGLHKQVDKFLQSPDTPEGGYKWTKLQRDRLKQITKQVQSDSFQEAMAEVGGDHLYDAIRSRLKQADASLWDDDKDLIRLRRVNIHSRARRAEQSKGKKDAEHRKKLQIDEDGMPIENKPRTKNTKSSGTTTAPPPSPSRLKTTKEPALASSAPGQFTEDKTEVTSETSALVEDKQFTLVLGAASITLKMGRRPTSSRPVQEELSLTNSAVLGKHLHNI